MILTIIILTLLAVLAAALIITVITGGTVFLGLFGDLIVFGLIVFGVTKLIKKLKRK